MTVRRLIAAAALVLLPLTGLAIAGPVAASPTPVPLAFSVYVATTGHDGATCGSAVSPCATITDGLARVEPGGTIHVGPGTYAEQLVISKSVAITGAGSSTVIAPASLPVADSDTDSSTPQDAIVDVTPGTVGVSLSSLTVNGAGAQESFAGDGCDDDFVGVYFHSSSGTLEGVTVENIELPIAQFGCPDGQGVYVDAAPGAHSDVAIDHSSVVSYDNDGIACDDAGAYCTITGSTVTGIGPTPLAAQIGVQIWSGSASLSGDTISQNTYTDPNFLTTGSYAEAFGVRVINAGALSLTANHVSANDDDVYLLEDANPAAGLVPPSAPAPLAWSVVGNILSDATIANPALGPGGGIGDGLDIDSTTQPVLVSGNTASDDPEFGIALLGTDHAALDGNTLDGDGIGIFGAFGTSGTYATDDLVTFNTIEQSDLDGIYLYGSGMPEAPPGQVSGLTFLGNTIQQSGGPDVVDASTGAGTAGTANDWIDNECTSSSPTGLCTASHPIHGFVPFFGFGWFVPRLGGRFWRW